MKPIKNLNKQTKILLLSLLGFVVTGVMFYPFGLFWDSGRTLNYILIDGHANVDNWLGWYFPLLWEGLYRITGIPYIMGTWINLVYWVGITLLYLNIFNVERRSLWWYVAFAWFPGTLMFILNITNNALMMGMLILGLAFFAIYANKKKMYWTVLSIITILQCAFIRRESFIIVIPLIIILLLIFFQQSQKQWRALLYACVTSFVIFLGVFGTEKVITNQIANYDYMDALSITCLHDMSAVTYLTSDMKIPTNIFKEEYADGKACFEDIMTMPQAKDSICNGDNMFHHIGPYMKIEDRYMLHMPKSEVIEFYTHNIVPWLKFRARFIFKYFWFRQEMCYTTTPGPMIQYQPASPNIIQKVMSFVVPAIFGSLQIFYYLSLIVLVIDWRKTVSYRFKKERLLLRSLICIAVIETILVLFTSIAVQYRYLYPVCVLQYIIFIYVLSRLKYKEIGQKLSLIEN